MDVYRQKLLPVIYTRLPFVRRSHPAWLADLPEDDEWLEKLKAVASGTRCISTLEPKHVFMVKCVIPDDILEKDGSTGEGITWYYYSWKMWDVQSLVTGRKPAEAIPVEEAGLDPSFLETKANHDSCIRWLEDVEARSKEGVGYSLSKDMKRRIREIEEPMLAGVRLDRRKANYPTSTHTKSRSNRTASVSPKLRDRIMRRDGYRCIFCHQQAGDRELEVNHVIPKNLVKKLNLDESLLSAEHNLCVTCFNCNRGKSDNLATEDVQFYIAAFSEQSHPNHGIVKYLEGICRLQGLR